MTASPLLDIERTGAFIMLAFAAILIFVVMRNVKTPVKFAAWTGPLLVAAALVLFTIPILGDILRSSTLTSRSSIFHITAAVLLPVGLYLMRPATFVADSDSKGVEDNDS
jgi:hypothetical protein